MIKGLYISASGMVPRLKKQELTANNIANASATGYKKDMLFTHELSKAEKKLKPQKSDWQRPMVDEVYTNFAPGVFDRTGNSLDIAIEGDGFFTIEMLDGSTALTRAGAFMVNKDGFIVFPGGALLMGEGGPIEVAGNKVVISKDGVVEVDGASTGKITPVTVDDVTQLDKIGGLLFLVPENVELKQVEKYTIHQGYLETSNVDIVREMIEMIISFRNYEADAKSVQIQDQSLEHLFNRVASRG